MRNSQYILEVFDSLLSKPLPFDLHLLGGAALDLVYGITRFSEDVDMICTLGESKLWDSSEVDRVLEKTNKKLEKDGLYITHIFREDALVRIKDWPQNLVPPPSGSPSFNNFGYDATSPEDIIISKITRFDEKDRLDILDLMKSQQLTKESISHRFCDVIVPEVWQEVWNKGLRQWEAWEP